jgi:hypothetical protein
VPPRLEHAGLAREDCPLTTTVTALAVRRLALRWHSTRISLTSTVEAHSSAPTLALTTEGLIPNPVPKMVIVSPALAFDGLMKAMVGMADRNHPATVFDSVYTPLAYSTRKSSAVPDPAPPTQTMRRPDLSLTARDKHGTPESGGEQGGGGWGVGVGVVSAVRVCARTSVRACERKEA